MKEAEGLIASWENFENFPWEKINANFEKPLKFFKKSAGGYESSCPFYSLRKYSHSSGMGRLVLYGLSSTRFSEGCLQ